MQIENADVIRWIGRQTALDAVMRSIPLGVVLVRHDIIALSSSEFNRFLKAPDGWVDGQTLSGMIHPDDVERTMRAYTEQAETQDASMTEWFHNRYRCYGGKEWAHMRWMPIEQRRATSHQDVVGVCLLDKAKGSGGYS